MVFSAAIYDPERKYNIINGLKLRIAKKKIDRGINIAEGKKFLKFSPFK